LPFKLPDATTSNGMNDTSSAPNAMRRNVRTGASGDAVTAQHYCAASDSDSVVSASPCSCSNVRP
jgi:hypothetical protein